MFKFYDLTVVSLSAASLWLDDYFYRPCVPTYVFRRVFTLYHNFLVKLEIGLALISYSCFNSGLGREPTKTHHSSKWYLAGDVSA